MNNDQFEVRFNAKEAEYIYNHGVNRGHTLSYAKVNRCYFLSAEAKQLYHNLCSYAWGQKHQCTPGQVTLRTELGWSRHSLDTYMNELRDRGFIWTSSQGVKKSLIYHLADLSSVAALVHSEVVHEVREKLVAGGHSELFYRALKAYKESELGKRIMSFYDDPFESENSAMHHYNEILEWFRQALRETPAEEADQEPQAAVQKTQRLNQTQQVIPPRRRPTGPSSVSDVVGQSTVDTKVKKPRKGNPGDVSSWTATDFYEHFEGTYTAKHKQPYMTSLRDRAQLKRLLEIKGENKQVIADYIKLFMEADFFPIKTMAAFCSAYTQSCLDAHAFTGKWPEFSKGKTPQTAIERDYEIDEDEFLLPNERGNKK